MGLAEMADAIGQEMDKNMLQALLERSEETGKPVTQRVLMGKVVLVKREYVRRYRGDVRLWEPEDVTHRPGWVVGVRSLQEGRRVDYGEGYAWEPNTGPAIKCLLVAYWPSLNPVKVPLDGWGVSLAPPYPSAHIWTNRDRIEQRNAMEDCPRDEKGRWEAQ